jgi:hypothetical protein
MSCRKPSFVSLLPPFAAAVLGLTALTVAARPEEAAQEESPTYDKKLTLLYTVNNLGYSDTCG